MKSAEPARLILANYRRLFGRDLVHGQDVVQSLFEAPCAVLSALGPPGSDHLFNYANRTALALFEYEWTELIGQPSSTSAEPVHRDERRRLLDEVNRFGFIENYSGIRISKNGRRFRINHATVFNLLDPDGHYVGQAATFEDWAPV
ncbi:MAG: MEKHLA domain-containing protein [Verrucomicrobia bacterium]|nr:MEKHLA domain-containing protein [Verrucomicrobiota bacterium]MDA1203560.1 MEKHLA domain-containing protein [Verrucomicrobiota bacterium]